MDDIPLPVARLDNKAAYDKMAVRPKTRKAARKARGKPQHIHISTSQVNGFSGSFTTQQEHTSEDEELKETSPKAKRSRPPILSISEDPQEHTPNEEAPAPKRYSMLGRPPGGPTMVVPSLADVQMIKLKKTPTFGDEKKPEQSCDNSNARVARSLTSPSASPSETQKKTKSDIFSKPKILRKKSSKTTKTESVMSDTTTTKTERIKVKGETVPKKLASMSPVKKRTERNNKNQVKAKDPNSPSGFKGFSYFERVKEEKKKAKKELETEKNQSGNNSKPADEESTKPENKSKDVLADKKTTVDKEDINTGGKQIKERFLRKATVPEPSKVMNESIDKAIDNQRKDFEKKNVDSKHIVEVESKALTENRSITKAEVRLAEKPIPKPRRILSPKHEDNKNIAKSILKMGVDVLEQENGSTLKHGECVSKEDKNHDHTDPVQYTREIVRTEEFTEPDETTVSDVLNKDMQEPKPAVETNVKSSKKVAPFANEGGRKKDEDVDTQETIQSPSKTYFSIKPLRETGIPQSEMSQINHTFVMRQVSLEKKDSEIKHQPEHKAISETPLTKLKKSEKNQNIHIVQEKDKNMNIEQAKAPTEFNIQDHTIGPHKKSDSFESDFTQVKLKQAGSQNQKMVSMKKPAPNSHEKGNSEVPKPVDPVSSLSPVETAISIFGERRNKSVKLSSAKQTPTRSQRTRSFNIDSEKETPGDNIHKTKESTGPLKTPENLEALIIHSDTRIDDQNNNILKSGKSNITGQRKNSLTERKETIMTDTPESRPRSKTEISSTKPNEVSSKPSWVGLARRRSKLWEEKSLKPVKPLPGDHTTSKTDSENDLKRPESLSITSSLVTGKSESPQMAVKEREDTIVNNPTQRLTPLTPSAVLCPNRKNSIPDINGQQSKKQQASPTKSLKESQPGKPAWLAIAMQKQKRWTKEEAI